MPSYSRLTYEKRYTIEAMIRKGSSPPEIAAAIGVCQTTVSRELNRNGMNRDTYSAIVAEQHARSCRRRPGSPISPELRAEVETRLRTEQWSPEQISAVLKKEGIGSVSHEAIYQHIYADKRTGGNLHRHLRHKCKSYRKRGSGRERRGRIRNQVMIDQRPPEAENRSRIGDWEADTIIGRPGGKVLVTLVERKSRYTLIELAESKEARSVTERLLEALSGHREKVETLTFDNGKEFAWHELVAEVLEASTYFAHPYHSWERGLNENTNGLIRQYFPKGSSFDKLTHQDVKQIEHRLNRRPRKCLSYQTPQDIFHSTPPVALAG
ncbi:MAG: IS30 family transposase [Luteolibacter sp.]